MSASSTGLWSACACAPPSTSTASRRRARRTENRICASAAHSAFSSEGLQRKTNPRDAVAWAGSPPLEGGMTQPVFLYYFGSPNSRKVTILLEELGVPYEIVPIQMSRG